jgi:hypothetical protein
MDDILSTEKWTLILTVSRKILPRDENGLHANSE